DARRTLEAAVAGHPTLVLDLADLVFCGAAGLHVIADLSQRLADLGGGLTVCSPSPAVTRMLGYLGLEGLVAVGGDRRTDVGYAAATDADELAGAIADSLGPLASDVLIDTTMQMIATVCVRLARVAEMASVTMQRRGRFVTVATTDPTASA